MPCFLIFFSRAPCNFCSALILVHFGCFSKFVGHQTESSRFSLCFEIDERLLGVTGIVTAECSVDCVALFDLSGHIFTPEGEVEFFLLNIAARSSSTAITRGLIPYLAVSN